jgi:hypothetical protein
LIYNTLTNDQFSSSDFAPEAVVPMKHGCVRSVIIFFRLSEINIPDCHWLSVGCHQTIAIFAAKSTTLTDRLILRRWRQ